MKKRIIILTRDICILTGFSLRKAQRLVQDMRDHLNKEKHQRVTVKEFATYMGIDPEEIVLT